MGRYRRPKLRVLAVATYLVLLLDWPCPPSADFSLFPTLSQAACFHIQPLLRLSFQMRRKNNCCQGKSPLVV